MNMKTMTTLALDRRTENDTNNIKLQYLLKLTKLIISDRPLNQSPMQV